MICCNKYLEQVVKERKFWKAVKEGATICIHPDDYLRLKETVEREELTHRFRVSPFVRKGYLFAIHLTDPLIPLKSI